MEDSATTGEAGIVVVDLARPRRLASCFPLNPPVRWDTCNVTTHKESLLTGAIYLDGGF